MRSYHNHFTPAPGPAGVSRAEVILAVHVVCADTEEEARRQLAPVHVMYRNLAQGGIRSPLLTPDDAVKALGGLPPLERYESGSGIPPRFIGGTVEQVGEQLRGLARDLALQEIMIQDLMTDHEARLHSYELLAGLTE